MVNSIKLTKLEGRVLKALSKQRPRESYEYYPKEGNDTCGLASMVYGQRVLNRERVGGHICSGVSVAYSARSSLSRALKSLWRKGMVMRCTPFYHGSWESRDKERDSGGFWYRKLLALEAIWADKDGGWNKGAVSIDRFTRLPHRTRVWWIPTDRGKDVIEEITGVKRLRERCRKCECWDEERDQCVIERIGKRALTLEECGDEGFWHWVEYEGWVPVNIGTVSSGEVAR